MKKIFSLLLSVVLVGGILGCETNKTRVAEGAAIGGGLGALAGGLIERSPAGALVGGAIGATAGAVVGAQIDKKPAQEGTVVNQMTLQQIVDLTKQGISSDEIIGRIKATNTKLVLTQDDVSYLHKQGVSQRVIEAVQGLK